MKYAPELQRIMDEPDGSIDKVKDVVKKDTSSIKTTIFNKGLGSTSELLSELSSIFKEAKKELKEIINEEKNA